MTNVQKYQDFIVDGEYIIHAQGFNEPVTGKIIDIDIAEDGDVLLVVEQSKNTPPVKIFAKAISGWSENTKAA